MGYHLDEKIVDLHWFQKQVYNFENMCVSALIRSNTVSVQIKEVVHEKLGKNNSYQTSNSP